MSPMETSGIVTTMTFMIGSSSTGRALRMPSLKAAAPANLNATAAESASPCDPSSTVTLTSMTG